jgi:hypothetical protein
MEMSADLLMEFIEDISKSINYKFHTSENVIKAEIYSSCLEKFGIYVEFGHPSQPFGLKLAEKEEWEGSVSYIFNML